MTALSIALVGAEVYKRRLTHGAVRARGSCARGTRSVRSALAFNARTEIDFRYGLKLATDLTDLALHCELHRAVSPLRVTLATATPCLADTPVEMTLCRVNSELLNPEPKKAPSLTQRGLPCFSGSDSTI